MPLMETRQPIAIIGAGPAGLAAAEWLSAPQRAQGREIVVYDQMPSVARKFLMAGRSGLNLTHAENLEDFLTRYGSARHWLAPMIDRFPPEALRQWAEALGQPCFTGSSGRVFPQAMKASPLLRAWLARLAEKGVRFALRHRWEGWDAQGALRFNSPDGAVTRAASAVILALGGASWPRLGSDGDWTGLLPPGSVTPLVPANCGFLTALPEAFHTQFHGEVLHSVTLTGAGQSARGDVTITRTGIEGAPVYRLSASWREVLAREGRLRIALDLRPGMDAEILAVRLDGFRARESQANRLRRLGLSPVARWLIREAMSTAGGGQAEGNRALAGLIKACPLILTAPDILARAISTAGGVRHAALDANLMLREHPGVFVAGEMLDWEAPTGGYLLQACFATGRAAAEGADSWLAAQREAAHHG
ncbi:TIGR03862 family flavoprotein [Asaia krungthepensis]|uniref:Glutathione reductase n=1 Tax=Asaia krungthepensis NRIC 0535 TaxID=1307925 RepID=A0ABQ0PYU5_9PROT|nr:TIGR03862 family flavoprotein [Asaia krungthepensis]GBQ84998.1 glutathione reductase [Asaia krungthepensis NRIC 0535]